MPDFQVSIKRDLSHDTFHQGRLSLTVLSHKGDFLTSFDGHIDLREHRMLTIGLSDALAYHRIVTTAQTGRELQVHGGIINLIHLYRHDLLQLFNLLLYLHSLGCLITETLYKLAHVRNLLLLILVGTQLLLPTLFAKHHILVVFYPIVNNMST